MTKWLPPSVRIVSACASLLVLPSVQAQDAQHAGHEPAPLPAAKTKAEKKTPGWFRHPRARTPDEQLKLADELLAAGKKKDAARQYDALVRAWHESAQAPAAQLAYAKLVEDRRDYAGAFDEFQYLVDHFAGRFPFDEALDHQYRIANTVMTQRHGRLLFGGYRAPERALPYLEQIMKNGPQWRNAAQVQFDIGVINEENKEYDAAIRAYEVIPVSYPDSPLAEEAAFRRAQCLYTVAMATPRHEPGYREAMSALSMFSRDYPRSAQAETAGRNLDQLKEQLAGLYFERAVFYDRISRNPRAAVIAYADFIRNFPTSELAAQASERMDALKLETENKK